MVKKNIPTKSGVQIMVEQENGKMARKLLSMFTDEDIKIIIKKAREHLKAAEEALKWGGDV